MAFGRFIPQSPEFKNNYALRHYLLYLILLCCLPLSANGIEDWSRFDEAASARGTTELSANIIAGFESDIDKAAAIFYWVTHNVAYDVKLLGKMLKKPSGPTSGTLAEIENLKLEQALTALTERKGVCQNYARLYRRLALAAGLECEFISGYSRGYVSRAGSLGNPHAWNAVKIDGEWQLLDATWGAGGVNARRKFEFNFRPGYFMPHPNSFAYSHLPAEDEWQLLDSPYTRDQFLAQPGTGPGFVIHGLYDLNFNESKIILKRGAPLDVSFVAGLPVSEVICVNMTVRKQIPCTINTAEGVTTVHLDEKTARNMELSIMTPKQEMLVSYRLSVR